MVQVTGRPPDTVGPMTVNAGKGAVRFLLALVSQDRDSKTSYTKGEDHRIAQKSQLYP